MNEPIRMRRAGYSDLPSVGEIRRRVTRERHLVLSFECGRDDALLGQAVEALARMLPEYSVFDNGNGISVVEVVADPVVLANAQEFLRAAGEYGLLANEIVQLLATKFGKPREAFADPLVRLGLPEDEGVGELEGGWRYRFHGMECWAKNGNTGEVVEIVFGCGLDFGALDPYFFHAFLASTKRYEALAKLMPDPFHDAARALEILEREGMLRRVVGRFGQWGYVPG